MSDKAMPLGRKFEGPFDPSRGGKPERPWTCWDSRSPAGGAGIRH